MVGVSLLIRLEKAAHRRGGARRCIVSQQRVTHCHDVSDFCVGESLLVEFRCFVVAFFTCDVGVFFLI